MVSITTMLGLIDIGMTTVITIIEIGLRILDYLILLKLSHISKYQHAWNILGDMWLLEDIGIYMIKYIHIALHSYPKTNLFQMFTGICCSFFDEYIFVTYTYTHIYVYV